IVIVHDFDEPEFEPPSEIANKEPSFEEILRADFHQVGILSVRPIVEPVANGFATRRSFQAQAKELLVIIEHERLKSNSVYSAWAQSEDDNAILYLHGPDGNDQSSIARTISAEWSNANDGVLTIFFSFHGVDHPRRSSATFLCALIFRALSKFPSAFKSIQRHADWISSRPVLSVNELLIVIRALLSSPNLPAITVIVDGIDQCEDNVLQCLEDLTKLAKGAHARCKVLVTSSLSPTLSSYWNEFILNLDHQSKTGVQVQEVLNRYHSHMCVGRKIIDTLKCLESPAEARIRLKALLANPLAGNTLESAQPILEIPLHDLYAQSIGRLEGLKPWLTVALNIPNTTVDRSQAIPFLPSEVEVELSHALGLLIEMREGKVHFADSSVAKFAKTHLTDRVNALGAFPEVAILTHSGIARRCLQYLKISASDLEQSTIEDRLFRGSQGRSFESYAAMYWPYHYNEAEDKSILRWWTNHNMDRCNEAQSTPLNLAAQYGLPEVVRDLLLQDGGEASVPDRATAFEAALQFRQLHVARQLLQFTASTEKALLLTAGIGDLNLFRDAFQRENGSSDTLLSKCVRKAAFHGHREVIDIILELLPDKASLLDNDTSVIIESVNGGHLHMIEHLLNVRSRPLSDETGTMILNAAAKAGDLEVFEFLVSK
ncbi:hypothetical protein P170DRAFT_494164, partial [Aspergillus steynii IBT 23096]